MPPEDEEDAYPFWHEYDFRKSMGNIRSMTICDTRGKTPTLTLKSIRARPVVLKLARPVVARIATLTDWPLILIDLYTEEGVIGRAYLEPYIPRSDALPYPCAPRSWRTPQRAPARSCRSLKPGAIRCTSLATTACQ